MTKINNPIDNIISTLKNKKILFLENDLGLYNGLEKIENILIENNIEYTCIFDVESIDMKDILNKIKECDAIIFQTSWVYEKSKLLREYLFNSKDKKIIIECFRGVDPTWYYKPDVVHDVYITQPPIFSDSKWIFYKLSDDPYWEYKNKFDK